MAIPKAVEVPQGQRNFTTPVRCFLHAIGLRFSFARFMAMPLQSGGLVTIAKSPRQIGSVGRYYGMCSPHVLKCNTHFFNCNDYYELLFKITMSCGYESAQSR